MKKFFILVSIILLVGAGCSTNKSTLSHTENKPTSMPQFCSPSGDTLLDQPMNQSYTSYCLVPEPNQIFYEKTPLTFRFRIVNNFGETVKNFQVAHEKIMHIILVRKDLNEFQHLHPEFDSNTGIFTLSNVIFPTKGSYFMYADFMAESEGENGKQMINVVSQTMISIVNENLFSTTNLEKNVFDESNHLQATEDIHTVTLSLKSPTEVVPPLKRGQPIELWFLIQKTQRSPGDEKKDIIDPLEQYLGALGHLIIIKEGTYDYIHAHPHIEPNDGSNNSVTFSTMFPSEGKYKLFFEFKNGGKVRKVEYVVEVTTGVEGTSTIPMMDHSGMDHK